MWSLFFFACLVCLIFLYLPGFILLKSCKIDSIKAAGYAPVVSIALIFIIGIAYDVIDIYASAASVGICCILLPLIVLLVRTILSKKKEAPNHRQSNSTYWFILAGYVVTGCLITYIMYISPLNGPDSFVQTLDNVFHYNVVQSLLQSGTWSFFCVDAYLPPSDSLIDPIPGASFYPAGWHILSALTASTAQTTVALASNAVNAVLIGVVFPSGVFSLLQSVFKDNKTLLICGIVPSIAVAAFPWTLYNEWPLYPNAASLCLAFIVAASFISLVHNLIHKEKNISGILIAFLSGLVSVTFMQPNTIFTLIVFLTPFCMWEIYTLTKPTSTNGLTVCLKYLPSAIFGLLVFVFFVIAFNLPFLQSTINFYWAPIMSFHEATISLLDFSLTLDNPQWPISLLLIAGSIYLILKSRSNAWFILSFAIAAVIFIIAASGGNTFLKHFLSGYWYTDPYRIAAFVGIFAIPICSCGLNALVRISQFIFRQMTAKIPNQLITIIIETILLIAFAGITFIPSIPTSKTMYEIQTNAYALNLNDWNYLDKQELNFINNIKSQIPSGSLVINQPHDGSMYAYGITGLNVYYRELSGYESNKESETSKTIREKLNQIDTNVSVKTAVDSIGADYVLLLKPDFQEEGLCFSNYHPNSWLGIESITEDTPGFTLVYEENGMKLFKIQK